mmetsp:Transcript_38751/g.75788  ORF Transcript_38751/g.75788 Transcript_38751/m.75788 type:complete len:218 (+) Transcript_38751:730-1383(+)
MITPTFCRMLWICTGTCTTCAACDTCPPPDSDCIGMPICWTEPTIPTVGSSIGGLASPYRLTKREYHPAVGLKFSMPMSLAIISALAHSVAEAMPIPFEDEASGRMLSMRWKSFFSSSGCSGGKYRLTAWSMPAAAVALMRCIASGRRILEMADLLLPNISASCTWLLCSSGSVASWRRMMSIFWPYVSFVLPAQACLWLCLSMSVQTRRRLACPSG